MMSHVTLSVTGYRCENRAKHTDHLLAMAWSLDDDTRAAAAAALRVRT